MSIPVRNIPKSVLETYLFSNTPMYLYKHLLSDSFVYELANEFDTETLIGEFNEIMETDLDNLDKVALSYSILVALLKKQPDNFNEILKILKTAKLEWANEIIEIGMAHLIPTNRSRLHLLSQFSDISTNMTNVKQSFSKSDYTVKSEDHTTISLINRK